jgi:diaminopimelate decarboxylase
MKINRKKLIKLAKKFGTPIYVYDLKEIKKNFWNFYSAFKNLYPKFQMLYAYKANSHPRICRLLKNLGVGADVVSGGELILAKKIGLKPEKVLFTNNAKSEEELKIALQFGCIINLDNFDEAEDLNRLAQKLKRKPKVSVRINPGIDPHTHRKIATGLKETKFGLHPVQVLKLYQWLKKKKFDLIGIHCHIGSQILDIKPFIKEAELIMKLIWQLKKLGIILKFVNLGGGLGIDYSHSDKDLAPKKLAGAIITVVKKWNKKIGYQPELWLEPGRYLVASAGLLLTKVLSIKKTPYKNFVNLDCGFNTLLRPAFYNAYHLVIDLNKHPKIKSEKYDLAGNLCETGDILGYDRILKVKKNDILAFLDVGAYGFSMASEYNLRPKPKEIFMK